MQKDILSQLNEEQRKAAEHTEGPVLIVAGAGSGKTRTVTYRVANLVQKGVNPFNILCLTFTNKAASEMKERIIQLVGKDAINIWMGTFHSVCARILRKEGSKIGYPINFSIYDTDDSKNLLKNIVKDLDLDPKIYVPRAILNRISGAKNSLFSAEQYMNNAELYEYDQMSKKPLIGKIYSIYQERLFKSGSMDFDDLLFNMNVILRDFPEVLYNYQNTFKYIFVDEYQDTNFSQYLMIKQLAKRFQNICVVGDDAQSIYSFRGANIQNILNFQADYPDYKQFKLEQNYRSSSNIVNAANSIIINNKKQIAKIIWTANGEGEKIGVVNCNSDKEEGNFIAGSIFELKMNNQEFNEEFAVLYRTNAQSRVIEDALRKLNIPYKIFGGVSFYSRQEIKDLFAYLRVTVNPQDEEAIRRIINYPARGIGNTTVNKLSFLAQEKGITLWELLLNIDKYNHDVKGKALEAIKNFVKMINSFSALLTTLDAYNLAMHIAKTSGLYNYFDDDKTPEGVSRMENIESLFNAIQDYVDSTSDELTGEILQENRNLGAFMQEVSLMTDQDKDNKDNKEEKTDKVSLMTIHQAKGLEFKYVYIAGVEENLFPSNMSLSTEDELEEERRLFYVAVTRAKKQLFISYATSRYRWGQLNFAEPSRFISEIDSNYIDSNSEFGIQTKPRNSYSNNSFTNTANEPKQKINKTQKPITTHQINDADIADITDIKEGNVVLHKNFGKGKIIKIEGSGANVKAKVNFESVGVKQLLLKFAKLVIVE